MLWRATGRGHWPPRFLPAGVCRGDRGKQAGRAVKERKQRRFLSSASRLPGHRFFFFFFLFSSAVAQASVITFCNSFSTPRRSTHITFTSQRCIRVQTGLSTAWGGLHSAPANSAADKAVIALSANGTFW